MKLRKDILPQMLIAFTLPKRNTKRENTSNQGHHIYVCTIYDLSRTQEK